MWNVLTLERLMEVGQSWLWIAISQSWRRQMAEGRSHFWIQVTAQVEANELVEQFLVGTEVDSLCDGLLERLVRGRRVEYLALGKAERNLAAITEGCVNVVLDGDDSVAEPQN